MEQRAKEFNSACRKSDLDEANRLLDLGIDLNFIDRRWQNFTPLHIACLENAVKLVQRLIDLNADVNYIDDDYSLLMRFVSSSEIADKLIDGGANIHYSFDGKSALSRAISSRNVKLAHRLLDLNADYNINSKVLHSATFDLSLTKRLVELNCDVNAVDVKGRNALKRALESRNMDVAMFLVDAKANINISINLGCSLLLYAVLHNEKEFVNKLMENGASPNGIMGNGRTPLTYFADSDVSRVKFLLSLGADVNEFDDNGKLPLNYAQSEEMIDVLKAHDARMVEFVHDGREDIQYFGELCSSWHPTDELLAMVDEINFDTEDRNGYTALMHALSHSSELVSKILSFPHVNVNHAALSLAIKKKKEISALNIIKYPVELTVQNFLDAIHASMYKLVIQIIEMKAIQIPTVDDQGTPLLVIAIIKAMPKLLYYLLEINADVNATDKYGYTALHAACSHRRYEFIPILIEAGADVNAITNYKETPLKMFKFYGELSPEMLSCNKKWIKYLIDHGAE